MATLAESFFGADFGTVRIHVDGEVSALGMRAFTWGEDIYFAPGQYAPEGRKLRGHELKARQEQPGQRSSLMAIKGGRAWRASP